MLCLVDPVPSDLRRYAGGVWIGSTERQHEEAFHDLFRVPIRKRRNSILARFCNFSYFLLLKKILKKEDKQKYGLFLAKRFFFAGCV